MIDIFSVKTWEFSEKEKEARTKAVIPEVEALNENNTRARSSEADEVEAVRPNNTRARSSEADEADEADEVEAVRPEPDPPRQKKTFYDIGLEVLGKQCNKTRSVLIDEMMKRYSISEAKATSGLEKLISSNVIELSTVETNVERYYMADSTPF